MVTIPREIYEILKIRERWPILTIFLAIILILIFVLQQAQIILKEDYGFIPARALDKPWTFITSIFLHSGFAHLMYNLLGLIYFGVYLESASDIKRENILATFFLSGVAGSFGFLAVAPVGVGAIGASGAIFGLLGVLILIAPYEFFLLALLWAIVGFILDPVYVPHIAGLLIGISLGIYWRFRKSPGFT